MYPAVDVLVLGGGTAGVVAALQAGRAGARTLLVEKNGALGGTLVAGGIPFPSNFFAHGRQVIAGIGWELCCKARREVGAPVPATGDAAGQQQALALNPAVFAALADEALVEAGVELLFHAMPAALREAGDGWEAALCTKTGLRALQSKILVDCTGDANGVALAGFPLRRYPEPQPGTLVFRLAGYDAEALDYESIQRAFEAEVAAGRLKRSDAGWSHGQIAAVLKGYGGNRIHVCAGDASTSEGRTAVEVEGRRILLRLLRFFRRQPGLETCTVASCAPECGVRDTVTILGCATMTAQDYLGGRLWEDAVCYAYYPIDIHRPDRVEVRPIPDGVVPTIPFGALRPAGSRRLVVAGRCAAGDQEAHSAFRVEASCMAMGQAAGAAAALAAGAGIDFDRLSLDALRRLLRRHGAVVPGSGTGGADRQADGSGRP